MKKQMRIVSWNCANGFGVPDKELIIQDPKRAYRAL